MSRHGGQPLPEPMVAVATVTPPPVGPRGERRAERHRRRRRNRLLVALLVLLLVALAAGLTLAHSGGHRKPVVAVARQQRTLLLGIGATGGPASSAALYGLEPATRTGADLLLPPDTLVDGPGGDVAGSFSTDASTEFQGAVSDLLGVHVDGVWRLTPTGLAQLVDRIGGVKVDVDTTIDAGGLTLSPGSQQLAGAAAAGFALYGADTEQAELNRTRLVFDAILAKLPAPATLAAVLGSLGAESTSSLSPAALAGYLTALGASNLDENEQLLPVTTLDTGGSTPSFAFDPKQGPAVVKELFAGSLLSSDGSVGTRVEVINDSGRPDLATSARAKLSANGLTFVRAINDTPFHQYKQSSILVFGSSTATIAFGHQVARALGIPNAPVLVSSQTTTVADALAVLSDDYPG
jgi:hypothetical protein